MRWTPKVNRYGDRRTVTRFALFPVEFEEQIVWLEFYKLEQRWQEVVGFWTRWDAWVTTKIILKEKK